MHEHVYGTHCWLTAAQMDLSNYHRLTHRAEIPAEPQEATTQHGQLCRAGISSGENLQAGV